MSRIFLNSGTLIVKVSRGDILSVFQAPGFPLNPEPDQPGAGVPYKYYKYNMHDGVIGIHKHVVLYSCTQHLLVFILAFSHYYIEKNFFDRMYA